MNPNRKKKLEAWLRTEQDAACINAERETRFKAEKEAGIKSEQEAARIKKGQGA